LRYPDFKRQNTRRFGLRICNACQFQDCRNVCPILNAQRGHFRRGVEVAVAIGHSQTTLPQVENIALRIRKTLVDPYTENMVRIGREPVDFGIQSRAEIG